MFIKKRKAQIKISFGMIFSIIIIISIMAFSFYAIKFILDLQKTAQLGKFIDDFQGDIDSVWKSSQSSKKQEYNIPGKIEYVCFFNIKSWIRGEYRELYDSFMFYPGSKSNMFFSPIEQAGELYAVEIKNIDIERIASTHNPYCIQKKDGKINLILKKEFGGNLVVITEN